MALHCTHLGCRGTQTGVWISSGVWVGQPAAVAASPRPQHPRPPPTPSSSLFLFVLLLLLLFAALLPWYHPRDRLESAQSILLLTLVHSIIFSMSSSVQMNRQ